MKYLPFIEGGYSVAPGLIPMQKAFHQQDKLVFQIDDLYNDCINNKLDCRKENIHKYFCQHELKNETAAKVNRYIVAQLFSEHPSLVELHNAGDDFHFFNKATKEELRWNTDWVSISGNKYLSLFDALCSQLQEDFAICQLDNNKDCMAAIHLCAPNHWAASDKIGRSFDIVHAPVPGMEKNMKHYFKMLETVINKGPYTRFAWGISTDNRLNHHPQPPPGVDLNYWHGRATNENGTELFVRVERQNLIGFPEVNAFLFTIHTYFYAVDELNKGEKFSLLNAVKSMSPQSLQYKGLSDKKDFLSRRLL
jgi:heme-dependent oxidative N-demethylase alpha subunit-like protein